MVLWVSASHVNAGGGAVALPVLSVSKTEKAYFVSSSERRTGQPGSVEKSSGVNGFPVDSVM